MIKSKYDMTPFLQRLKNKYIKWKWDRIERKTKLYDSDSEFITYANKNGFIHSPFHYAKRIIDCAPVIGHPDFNVLFDIQVKNGDFVPIEKELVK